MNLLRWAVGIFFVVVVMACQAYTVDAPALPDSDMTGWENVSVRINGTPVYEYLSN